MSNKDSGIDDDMLNDLLSQEISTTKEDKSALTLIAEKDRSLNLAFLGVGQAGSRLAEVFYGYGYSVGVLNTAVQDLKFIKVPERKKMLLDMGLAGAGKDLSRGEEAVQQYRDEITAFLEKEVVGDADMLFLAISGGGGTGAGSVVPAVEILASFGRPVGVIYVLPMQTDDAGSKKNALTTLAKLAKLASTDVISTLIVVDNAKIEAMYSGLSQVDFWQTANEAIAEPLHLFNTLTHQASNFTSLDASDFGKIIAYGDCSLLGCIEVENYEGETALAEAALASLRSSMLADFDLKQAKVGGILVVAKEEVLRQIPMSNLNYMFHIVSEQTDNASLYKGVYAVNTDSDSVKVYTFFAGLGLPVDRINALKAESAVQEARAEEKVKTRATAMALDLGEKTTTAASEIHQKIKAKNSGFNKLANKPAVGIIDKRKK